MVTRKFNKHQANKFIMYQLKMTYDNVDFFFFWEKYGGSK